MSEVAALRAELEQLKRQFLARVGELEGRIAALETRESDSSKHADKVLPPVPEDSVIEGDKAEETEEARLARLKSKPRAALTEEEALELDILEEKEELRKIKEQKEQFKQNQVSSFPFTCLVFSQPRSVGSTERAAAKAAAAAGCRCCCRLGAGRHVVGVARKGQEPRQSAVAA